MVRFTESTEGITPEQLGGFFDGWPMAPSPETHLRLLNQSDHVVLAVDDAEAKVVGFVTAVADGVLCAYVSLLEVLPAYRGRGIGRELMLRMLQALRGYYMIDLTCNEELRPFYESLGFTPATGMIIRDRQHQAGRV